MKNSGLGRVFEDCTFENFETTEEWQRITKNKALNYVKDPQGWFFLGGASGCGKTHLCTAIVRELIKQNLTFNYMVWNDVVKRLNNLINEPDYYTIMNTLKKVDILYIDDFFKPVKDTATGKELPPTPGEIKRAMELIDYRYREGLITIISTELSIDKIRLIDEAIAGRIYQRASKHATQLTGKEKNHRFRG